MDSDEHDDTSSSPETDVKPEVYSVSSDSDMDLPPEVNMIRNKHTFSPS